MKLKKIPVDKAVGHKIAHDMTRISPDEGYKGAFFKKGHVITENDVPLLKKLGKNYIYELRLSNNEIHEDDFAVAIAGKLAGENIVYDEKPSEGKITFYSKIKGLFKLDRKRVIKLNSIAVTSFPTIHSNFPVNTNQRVAAFRIIPLVTRKKYLERALQIADKPLIWVKEYRIKEAGLIITGNEIYEGLVEDRFETLIKAKLGSFGVKVRDVEIVPDDTSRIKSSFLKMSDLPLVVVTGGSSVDPDDVTKKALKSAGVKFIREGNPIQPANNMTIGYFKEATVCVVPAGALFYKASAFDIFLPRILAKDTITRRDIAEYSIGGLCHFCKVCVYPVCPFGKS